MKLKKWLCGMLAVCMASVSVMAYDMGDVDMDGELTANDAALVMQHVLNSGTSGLSDEQIKLAKVTGGDVIVGNNAAEIMQKVLNNSYQFPVERESENTTETVSETETETTTEAVYNKIWNFSDSQFNGLDIISNDMEVDGISFVKGSQKNIAVRDDIQTLNNNTYTHAVSYDGGGAIDNMSLSFEVSGPCIINVVLRSGGIDTRTLNIANAAEVVGSVPAEYGIKEYSYYYTGGADRLYMYSAGSRINIYEIEVIYDGSVTTNSTSTTEATTETTTISTETTTKVTESSSETTTINVGDGVVVYDYSGLVSAINSAANNGGGNVYVSGTEIDCNAQIKLSRSNANVNIIGLTNADGTSPRLNFATFRDNRTKTGESGTGVYITGSYYNLNNLIIENAPDCGIRIKGSGSGNCKLENLVLRYNNNSGLSITSGGANNTMRYVDSYRNCDLVQKAGSDADGFSVKLAAGGGNTFYNCRAWENGDDGWDSYDRGGNISDISYEECAVWHNGEADIFTGEYDWKQGNPLDKNLIYIQAILASDPSFETKYNNGEITSWPKVTLKYFGTSRDYNSIYENWGGNPNGYKFGSAESDSKGYRYIKNCLAFDHAAKGFDQNNGACTFDLENTVSFGNQRNYVMTKMTANSAKNAKGFDGTNPDELPSGMTVEEPSTAEQSRIRGIVEERVNYILDCVDNDRVPGEVLFDIY